MMNIKNLGYDHFDDLPTEECDHTLGKKLAEVIGSTFINEEYTIIGEWETIAKAIRVHGLKIIEA